LLDKVLATGEPYIGSGTQLKLQRSPGGPLEDAVVDFIYQPVLDRTGAVDGIFVLVTDVTARSRAEAALRLTNWQLDEERARLASLVQAEQRAQAALRKFNETLEANVKMRTAELTKILAAQSTVADRLRATFETSLIYQGYLDVDGTLLDANRASLDGIGARLHELVGDKFWDTPWFTATDGLPDLVKEGVQRAARGEATQAVVEVNLPNGRRRFELSLRPAYNGKREVIGIVPQAVDITDRSGSA
jgi:PAS domain S-box-containing protein